MYDGEKKMGVFLPGTRTGNGNWELGIKKRRRHLDEILDGGVVLWNNYGTFKEINFIYNNLFFTRYLLL